MHFKPIKFYKFLLIISLLYSYPILLFNFHRFIYRKYLQSKTIPTQNLLRMQNPHIAIEYCTNCSTHNWCTHHNEEKYQQTFLDLQFLIKKTFKNVKVVGNEVPKNLVPVKTNENKYFDKKTNKYVIFPAIGAFEVVCDGQIVFSKKDKNSWPNLNQITAKISQIIDQALPQKGNVKKTEVSQFQPENDTSSEHTVAHTQPKIREQDKNSTFYPSKQNPNHELSLTDHFKRYKLKKNVDKDPILGGSEGSEGRISKITAEDIKQLNKKTWGNEENIPNFIKNKAYIQENNGGKKEMLINLSSIEEENEQKKGSYQLRKNKNSINRISKLGDEINNFEKRFSRFERKVEDINQKRMEFENHDQSQSIVRQNSRALKNQSPRKSDLSKFNTVDKIQEYNRKYNAMEILKEIKDNKNKKIEDYIHATSEQKNEKLSEIYGPYIFKKKYESANKRRPHHKYRKSNNNSFSEKAHFLERSTGKNKKLIDIFKNKEKKLDATNKKVIKKLDSSLSSMSSSLSQQQSLDSRIHGSEDSNIEIEVSPELVEKHKRLNKLKANKIKIKAKKEKNLSNKVIPKKMLRDSEIKEQKYHTANNFYTKKKETPDIKHQRAQQSPTKDHFSIQKIRERGIKKTAEKKPVPKIFNPKPLSITKQNIRNKQSVSQIQKKTFSQNHFAKISQINTQKINPNHNDKLEDIYAEKENNYKQWRADLSNVSHQLKKMKKRNLKHKRDSSLFEEQKSMINGDTSYEEKSSDLRNTLSFQPQSKKSFEEAIQNNNLNSQLKKNRRVIKKIKEASREVSSSESKKELQNKSPSQENSKIQTEKSPEKAMRFTQKQSKMKKKIIRAKEKKDKIIESDSSLQQQNQEMSSGKSKQKLPIRHQKNKKLKSKQKNNFKIEDEKVTDQSNFEESIQTPMTKKKQEKIVKSQESQNQFGQKSTKIKSKKNELSSSQISKKKSLLPSKTTHKSQSPKQKQKKVQDGISSEKQNNLQKHSKIKKKSYKSEEQGDPIGQSLDKNKAISRKLPQRFSEKEEKILISPKLKKQKRNFSKKQSKESKSPQLHKIKDIEEKSASSSQSIPIQNSSKKDLRKKKIKESPVLKKKRKISDGRGNQKQDLQEGDISNNVSKFSEQNKTAKLSHFKPSSKKNKSKSPEKSNQKSSRKQKMRKEKISSISSKRNSPTKNKFPKKNQKKKGTMQKKMKQKKMITSSSSSEQVDLSRSQSVGDQESLHIESQISERSKVPQNKLSKLFGENQTIKETTQNNESPVMSVSNTKSKRGQSQQEINKNSQSMIEIKNEQKSQRSMLEKTERQRQLNNVASEAKPKKIYAADQIPPEMCDRSTQTDNKVTKYVQTSQISDFSEEEENMPKKIKNKSKNKNQQNTENFDNEREQRQIFNQNESAEYSEKLQEVSLMENNQKQIIFQSKVKSKSKSKSKVQVSEEQRVLRQKPTQAKITQQFYGIIYEMERKSTKLKLEDMNHFIEPSVDERSSRLPISTILKKKIKTNSVLFGINSIQPEKVIDNSGQLTELLRVLRILTSKNQFLILRLFENASMASYQNKYGVWLCDNFKWRCFIVDHMVAVDENKNPLYLDHQGNQYWPIILHKALTELFGGSENLIAAPSGKIFHALTGCNNLSFRIKEDISKNTQMLKFITSNQRKNFILTASKRGLSSIGEDIEEEKNAPIYYIISQKSINENQTLIRMKKDNSDAFWIKLDKFVIDFKVMEVLQLRVNHNFSTFDITNHNTGKFHIYQLDFDDAGFGCVSVSTNKGTSEFKVYLYKEEEDNVMKLVGQAKQKNKRNLFFDCSFEEARYFLFIEMSSSEGRISFMGQVKPEFTVKQSVKGQSFKNDKTEYIPVSTITKKRDSGMPKFMAATMSGGFQASQKDNQSIVEFDKLSRVSKQSHQSNFKRDFIKKQFIEFLMENS